MRPSDAVLRRVMRRRCKGRRPAAVVDHIKADDGPEFEALVKHIAELGFGQASFTSRSLTLDVPEYFGRYCRRSRWSAAHHPGEDHERDPHRGIIRSLSRTSRADERRRSREETNAAGVGTNIS